MRGKRAIIAMVFMGLVLGGAWVVTRTGGRGPSAVRLLQFDPTAVTELRLTFENDAAIEIVTRLDSGFWVVQGASDAWPVDASVIRGAMTKLRSMLGEPTDVLETAAATLVISGAGGPIATLRMSAARLAGRGRVEVTAEGSTTTFLTDGELLDVFTSSGLLPWRDQKALPVLGAGATRLTLGDGETEIGLALVRGRWGMTTPFRERTDQARVNAVLRSLAALEFDRFIDDQDLPHTARASATLEVDLVRSGESLRQRLEVLGAANIGGEHVYVSVTLERNGEVWGAATGIIARGVLDEIPMDPAWYASRRAVDAVPADVARIWISRAVAPALAPLLPDPKMQAEVTLQRTLDGWAGPNPAAVALYNEAAAAFLTLLCDIDADEVGAELPEQYTPVALIQVGGRDGLPTGIAEIGVAKSGVSQIVIVRSGSMNRVYTDSRTVGLVDAILNVE